MYLGEQLKNPTDERLQLSAQLGVTGIVVDARPNPSLLDESGHWSSAKVKRERERIKRHGLRLDVLALDTGSVLVDSIYDRPRADARVHQLRENIRAAAAGGVDMVKYNLQMFGIARTGMVERRGGAKASVFRAADYAGRHGSTYWAIAAPHGGNASVGLSENAVAAVEGPKNDERTIDTRQAWDSIEYLVAQLLPVAEEEGVRLAAHPQDPAFPPGGLDGVEHVVGSLDGIRRFLALGGGSRFHGLNFCQGSIGAMAADANAIVLEAIEEFGGDGRIFMVHFRNLVGGYLDFEESFPDDGVIDMPAAIRAYRAIGYKGMLCPDHVPLSELDPGRERFFAFALGYTRGLLQAFP